MTCRRCNGERWEAHNVCDKCKKQILPKEPQLKDYALMITAIIIIAVIIKIIIQ